MLIAERQSLLADFLAKRGMCDMETLSAQLGVSASTVRRDVEGLEQRGLAKRTHGGVIWLGDKASGTRPYAFDQRMSVAGIHEGQLYNQNLLLVQAEQRMMEHAQQIVLLADSGKFGQQALARLCELEKIDIVVSDSALSKEHRKMIQEARCELIIAP